MRNELALCRTLCGAARETAARPVNRVIDGAKADVGTRYLDMRPIPRLVGRAENAKLAAVVGGHPTPEGDPSPARRAPRQLAVADHDVDSAAVGVQRRQCVRSVPLTHEK